MRYFLLFFLFFVFSNHIFSQNLHERTWFFGMGHSLHFDNGVVKAGGIPLPVNANDYYINSGNNLFNIATSDNAGDLQFFVQIKGHSSSSPVKSDYIANGFKIFDKLGVPFPHGNIQANGFDLTTSHVGTPMVVPYPNYADKYLLFYVFENSLRYSVVDMTLNNGMGDVDTMHKDIVLTPFSSIIGFKMVSVRGCKSIWLVVRSLNLNEYYSFEIDENGVNPVPLVSPVGAHPAMAFVVSNRIPGGWLKASHNSKYLAAATDIGIELYDFEPCSGRLKNARIIDTLPAYGLCFSPDDSKLYASYNNKTYGMHGQGSIYQYDLRLNDPAAIAASRTVVMRNPIYEVWTPLGPVYFAGAFGELKIGLDGKMYVSKNNDVKRDYPGYCNVYYPGPDYDPVPIPPNNNCYSGQYMQVIHEPNRPGMACNPELDYLKLTDDYRIPGLLLQSDIKVAPVQPPDTIQGYKTAIEVCFRKEEVLAANGKGACYTWDDGSTEQTRIVKESGVYWVSYFKDCSHQTDTFEVTFIPLPDVPKLVYGCRREIELTIKNRAGDTTFFVYTLEKENSDLSYTAASSQGHTFSGLNGGDYTLRIQTPGGCDTTLHIQLEEYPSPEVTVDPTDATIRYGDTLQLFAEGAQSYVWFPPHAVDRHDIPNPITYPLQPTRLFVVGTNAYGCRDTGYVNIDIDYTMPDLVPNAFSPNGDGLNDVFKIEGITYQRILAFKVFNRFGQLVFSATDPDKGWDGTYNGQPCEVGTYYYFVQLAYPDGRERVFKGDVVLLR